jgi:hypothetical protein
MDGRHIAPLCQRSDFPLTNLQVRAKMLHASSKGGLLKSLGEGRFKQNMFFTSQVRRVRMIS